MTERIRIPNTRTIELPKLAETGHVTGMPPALRERIPELANTRMRIGLSNAAIRNINLFANIAGGLEPGQNAQVDMNRLSNFRNAFFAPPEQAENVVEGEAERLKFVPAGWYGDATIVQTNIDPYEHTRQTLAIEGAPEYDELLERTLWTPQGLDFKTTEYTALGGLKAVLYMRGDLPDSEMDDEPEYSLGVAVYWPETGTDR